MIVLVAAACGSGKKIGGGLEHRHDGPRQRADHLGRVQDDARCTATEVGVSPDDDHRHRGRRHRLAAPSRPVPGLGRRREGVGEVHQRQRRARLPPGRREDRRLEAHRRRRAELRSRPRAATRSSLVGTTALFLDNMKPAEQCKDKAGPAGRHPRPRRAPDVRGASSARRSRSRCCPAAGACPYSGTGVRTFKEIDGHPELLLQQVRQGPRCTACSSCRATCRRRSRRPRRCSRPTSSSASRRTPSSA